MADFTYMGSKKLLAPRIAEIVADVDSGPFLDLFSGIAAVGTQVATARAVWCNDVQHFSTLLTGQRFNARAAFESSGSLIAAALPHFARNRAALAEIFGDLIVLEASAISRSSHEDLRELALAISVLGTKCGPLIRRAGRHCLLVTAHGGTYFGVRQAIDLDSIRHAADALRARGEATREEHRWMVLALCRVASTISNSTGHFAQYLSPSGANVLRVARKRRMDVWSLWTTALQELQPLGTVAWRRGNRIFNSDAVSLLRRLSGHTRQPAVIYADPPYTNDQYSRYYHVLENIVLYDYPETAGKGQYRAGRYTSEFSLKSKVSTSFEDLIDAASRLRSVFILSYPSNGLVAIDKLIEALSRHFRYVESPVVLPLLHSTMGGSKGRQKHAVDENILVAYQDRSLRGCGEPWDGRSAMRRLPAVDGGFEGIPA